jgi:prepilin-type N-terminal cleavage/methylation domain-containing protein
MNKKSFTLIELLVVIAIIGILSSLVIARFSDVRDNARISNALQWSSGTHRLLGSNLLAHWKIDKCSGIEITDLSGYGNHGSIEGAVVFDNNTPSGGGCSLYFDASSVNNYMATNFNWNHLQNMTVSVWFKLKDWNSRGVMGSYYHTGTENRGRMFYRNSLGNDNSSIMRWLFVYRNNNDGYSTLTRIYNNISLDRWHQAVFSLRNDGSYNFYLDGSFYGTGTASNFFSWSSIEKDSLNDNDLFIGKGRSNGWVMNGNIDDIRIYGEALTAEEVSRIYAETKDKYLVYE